jgi:UDP-N-acetylglucosamine--N-acetylmuramyl-(pentapeptide) pyrophosphoryl-undecaprenol N-acetylglucosamine transferase
VHPQSTLSPELNAALVVGLMQDPERLSAMAAAARSAGKPNAARLLADLTEAIASKKTVSEFRKGTQA